jgi:peptidoglycan/xylan/chitin deacetylase (PgdA/CDA1 family)
LSGWKQLLWHRSGIVQMLSSRPIRSLFGSMGQPRASVFMLHDIAMSPGSHGEHTAERIAGVITQLRRRGFKLVTLESIVKRFEAGEPQLPDSVAFTLDDGVASQAEAAEQVFARLECPATIFLISGFLDGDLWPWDYKIRYIVRHSHVPSIHLQWGEQTFDLSLAGSRMRRISGTRMLDFGKLIPGEELDSFVSALAKAAEVDLPAKAPAGQDPMKWSDARALARRGIQFGAHSVTHRIMSKLSSENARYEIEESWKRVRAEIPEATAVFAWPTGRYQDFSPRDIAYAQAAGLIGAVATNDNYATLVESANPAQARYGLNRFALPSDLTTVLQYSTWLECGKQRIRGVAPQGAPSGG